MEPIDAVLIVYVAILVAAAITDVLWLKIPNYLVLLLTALFVIALALKDFDVPILSHVIPAIVIFVLGAVLFYFNKIGGGDVKLLGAATLWIGLDSIPVYLFVFGITGLVILVFFRLAREKVAWCIMRFREISGMQFVIPKSLSVVGQLPYGVVISASSIAVAQRLPIFS